MSQYTVKDLLVRPGEGEKTETDMVIKARSSQMGGDFSIMEGVVEPRHLLPPHTHEHEDQCVFVIEGELEFEVGGKDGLRFTAGAGSYVIKPRGVQHTFWNVTDKTVRYIELSGRDGFEGYVDSHKQGLIKSTMNAKRDFGMTMHVEQIPRLMRANGLTGLAAAKAGLPELPGLKDLLGC